MSQGSEPFVLRLFTNGWAQYALALSYVPIVALDMSGLCALSSFLHLLVLLGLLPVQVAIVVWRWRVSRWRALAPLVALLLALSFGGRAGQHFGDRLLRYRFESNRAAYEAVADEVLRGSYPQDLRPQHRHLGYWAKPLSVSESSTADRVVGVSFVVVSHGFAGHVGFVRLTDPSVADRLLKSPPPGGWETWLEQLDGAWYLVAN